MTETPGGDDRDETAGAATPPPEPKSEPPQPAAEAPAPAVRRAGTGRQGVAWLAALLVLLIAGVAASPFWAPAIMPLLPWTRRAVTPPADYTELAARLAELEQRPASTGGALDAIRSSVAAAAQRLDRLEAATDAIRSSVTASAQRLDRLEAATDALRAAVAAERSELQHVAQRRDAAEAQAANLAEELQKTRRQLAHLDQVAADLGDRVGRLEARLQAGVDAARTEAALLLSLLQLREAVATGRPFATEYDAFAALARGRAELAAAAEPLAQAAPGGIVSRAALRQGLSELGDRLKTAASPPGQAKWWEEALSRVHDLVRVRRTGAPRTGPEAVVDRAHAALAAGDLSGAVAALGGLSGSDAEAARQWLKTARARLAAEAALSRLQDLLTARPAPKPGARS